MRKRFSLFLLSLLAAVPVIADRTCKPVDGHFEASVVFPGQSFCPPSVPLCTAGRVWGGIQGDYQFVMSGLIPTSAIGGVPTAFFFAGKSTVSLKDGSQIIGTDTGTIDLPPGQGGFASLITFDNDGGQIRLRGHFDPVAGTTSGDYNGSVCAP